MPDVQLALFDLYADGHHPEYLAHLCRYWSERDPDRPLEIAGPDDLLDHPELGRELGGEDPGAPSFYRLPAANPGRSLFGAGIAHWRSLDRYLRERRPAHVLLMYFDHAQLGLALNLRGHTTRVSGIYFRPVRPRTEDSNSPSRFGAPSPLTRLRKRALLGLAARNPHLERLFVLDPIAAPALAEHRTDVEVRSLPEPISRPDERGEDGARSGRALRRNLNVGDDETLLLLFGMLTPRKGVSELIEALTMLRSTETGPCTVLLAGPLDENLRPEIERRAARISETGPVRVVLRDRFVPSDRHEALFRAADGLLMPYQHHVGMSAVLVRAATYGLPVIGPNSGTLGELIRSHRLGRAVDTTDPRVLAEAIEAFLETGPGTEFDPGRARTFASGHTPDAFARTLIDPILDDLPAEVSDVS